MATECPANDQRGSVPKLRVYAAVLDGETCPACADMAGLEFAPDDPSKPTIPNPNCTHRQGCRCGWL